MDSGQLALKQALHLCQLVCIVKLSKVLGLLGEVFPLDCRVSLVCDDVGCGIVQGGDQGSQVNI
jgi:hypothetical protein